MDSAILFWRESPSNNLTNNISLYNNPKIISSDPNFTKSSVLNGEGFWSDSSYRFMARLNFLIETEIDIVIMMTCDQSWSDLVVQDPLIPPKSHSANARTNENYSFIHNDFEINSEKYVFAYMNNVPVINQSKNLKDKEINYYSTALQSKFIGCNQTARQNSIDNTKLNENNYLAINYNDLITENFDIFGSLSVSGTLNNVISSNLTGFVFQFGDISDCNISVLGENINENFGDNYIFFNDSFQFPLFFLENNLSSQINFSKELKVEKKENFIDLLGKSIILRSFSVDEYINFDNISYYLGYLTFSQNSQCDSQGENCLGIKLIDFGVCTVFNEEFLMGEMPFFQIKIIVNKQISTLQTNTEIQILVNLIYFRKKYQGLSIITIKNEENEMNFTIDSRNASNFFLTNPVIFPLLYENALANKFFVKIIYNNEIISSDTCDIMSLSPTFDISEYFLRLNLLYPYIKPEENNNDLIYEVALGVGIPTLILAIIIAGDFF